MQTIETILMLPWYAFKYSFTLAFWFFIITYIISTDWYDRVSEKIKDKLDGK